MRVWRLAAALALSAYGCNHQSQDTTMPSKFFERADSALETAIAADDPAAIAGALAAGAQVNARGRFGVTPLMVAVDQKKPRAVTELLARGADPNATAEDGAGPVSLAVEGYRDGPDLILALLKWGGNPNTRRPDRNPVIMRFVNDRNCGWLKRMKAAGADLDSLTRAGDPIITEAAVGQDWDMVWCLIDLGARYDYEETSRQPIGESLARNFPTPDSPLYPYKVKVLELFKAKGLHIPPPPQ